MKTTSTAQYAADAANSSCLCALVSNDMAAENSRVNTTSTPMASNVESLCPILVRRYIATTGKTSRMKIIIVIMSPTNFSIRDAE